MPGFPSPTKQWHNNTYPSLSPTRPELSAKGKHVLITGGGTGIGLAAAHAFAEAGASHIALVGRREQPLLAGKADIEKKFSGVKVSTATADVSKQHEVDAAFDKFAAEGKVNVVISNAGWEGPRESITTVDPEQVMKVVDETVKGALFVGRAFLKHAAKDAIAINTSSAAAYVDMMTEYGSYGVAKLAAVRVWDALLFGNDNITVFHTQPGVVATEINNRVGGVKALGIEDHVSLPGTFYLWLASPEARFLKGKFVWANWDVDELKARAEEIQKSTEFNVVIGGWPFGAGQ